MTESTEIEPQTEPPREGTLAWLQLQEHVEVLGIELPRMHRLPAGAELAEPNGHCRVIIPERGRCRAPATRLYGVCLVHAGGGGGSDRERLLAMGRKGAAAKARLRINRQLLGVGPARAGNPRQIARLAAQDRATSVADALLAPLDDDELGSLAKQRAAQVILDATFPIQTTQVEVELPAGEGEVQALSWADMQALAARLLDE